MSVASTGMPKRHTIWDAIRIMLQAISRQRADINAIKKDRAALQLGGPTRAAGLTVEQLDRLQVRDVKVGDEWLRIIVIDADRATP